MEVIKKKINLEQAKNRYLNHLPYYRDNIKYEDDDVWGGCCCDIGVMETGGEEACQSDISWATALIDILPNEREIITKTTEKGETVQLKCIFFRYKNLMMNFHWLLNVFIPSCEFYKKCAEGLRNIEVETEPFIPEDLTLLSDKGEVNPNDKIGTEYCITPLAADFRKWFKTLKIGNSFMVFMYKLLNDKKHDLIVTRTPYIDVTFELTKDENDIGLYSPLYKDEWIPNKKYYLGEITYYNKTPYKLKKCDADKYDLVEMDGKYFNDINKGISKGQYYKVTDITKIPSKAFVLDINTHNPRIYFYFKNEGGITKVYHIRPYYKGYYSNTIMLTFFSDLDQDENINIDLRWEKATIRDISSPKGIHAISSSKVTDIARKIQSNDDSGNLLPFIVDSANTTDTELRFMLGNNNIKKTDDIIYADILVEINFYENIYSTTPMATFNERDKVLKTSEAPSGSTIIEFKYIIGAEINKNGDYIKDTGIKYNEKYEYEISKYKAIINHSGEKEYNYYNINLMYSLITYNDNGDVTNKNPIYSKLTVEPSQMINNEFLNIPIYKENDLLGIQDLNLDVDAKIERGKSAAYERHNILGEVKTFQDLLHYRNDFFGLS